MTEEATIRRGTRNARYTTVPNHVFEDDRLSMEARWLLGYLLSKPDDWTVRLGDIRKKGGCGRDKARSMVAELVDAGYAEKEPARKDGKFNGLCLVIYDEPLQVESPQKDSVAIVPQPEKPSTVQPSPVNPPLVNTDNLAIPENSRERGGAGARDEKSTSEKLAPEETPGRADFEKRVARFCNGRGFLAGPWANWDNVAFGWIAGQFAKLTPEERAEAERWRDAYLLDCRDRKTDPQGVGVFLRDKAWRAMDAALLVRAEKMREARLAPAERARPEGWAKLLGPVGMARFFATLLDGASRGIALDKVFITDPELREAWPEVWQFRALLRQGDGMVFGPRWHGLKEAMQPVPQHSPRLADWRAAFAERGWLWLAEFDRLDVVFCPACGPDGLAEFEAAVRGTGYDDGRCEAAE